MKHQCTSTLLLLLFRFRTK